MQCGRVLHVNCYSFIYFVQFDFDHHCFWSTLEGQVKTADAGLLHNCSGIQWIEEHCVLEVWVFMPATNHVPKLIPS